MRERPILFSAPMVRAILAGTKTQTRRIATPKRSIEPMTDECPYGQPGDRLWVRESFAADKVAGRPLLPGQHIVYRADWDGLGDDDVRWTPSIHMPRWASRITLEVTGVRVERLQDISEADALAEGVYDGAACKCAEPLDFVRSCGTCGGRLVDSVGLYRALWESINGTGSWDANPWVWVLEFRRLA